MISVFIFPISSRYFFANSNLKLSKLQINRSIKTYFTSRVESDFTFVGNRRLKPFKTIGRLIQMLFHPHIACNACARTHSTLTDRNVRLINLMLSQPHDLKVCLKAGVKERKA